MAGAGALRFNWEQCQVMLDRTNFNPIKDVSYKWTLGTVIRDGVYYFEWYVNGVLFSTIPMENSAGCVPERGQMKTVLARGISNSFPATQYRIQELRYHPQALSDSLIHLPSTATFVNVNVWKDQQDRPCKVGDGRAFVMANIQERTGLCVGVDDSPSPLCSPKLDGKITCTKAVAIVLNHGNPFGVAEFTREEYPTGSYAHLSNGNYRTMLDNLGVHPVYQGNFSSTHVYVAQITKAVACSNGQCDVSKQGSCVRCPYPALIANTAGPMTVDGYQKDCKESTIPCAPGTAEYAAYENAMMTA